MHRDKVFDQIMLHRRCNEEKLFYQLLIYLLDKLVLQAFVVLFVVVVVRVRIIDYYLLRYSLLLLVCINYSFVNLKSNFENHINLNKFLIEFHKMEYDTV
jgi:uncharacterized membrane protein YoaT (DUF817 family)